jgi:type I restriction enzyme S subunit
LIFAVSRILQGQLNDNLEATCLLLYEGLTRSSRATPVLLGNIASYVTKRSKFSALPVQQYISNENLLKDKKGISGYAVCPTDESVIAFEPGDTLIGNIRPYFKKIFHCDEYGGCNADVLVFRANNSRYQELLYCALSQDRFFDYVMSGATGTKMPRGDKVHILLYKLVLPSEKDLDSFIAFSQSAIKQIRENKQEQEKMLKLQQALLSQLAT